MMKALVPIARRATTLTKSAVGPTSGGSQALAARAIPDGMPGKRRVSTVANPTTTKPNGDVSDPGHVQFQYSESEKQRLEALTGEKAPPAIGHTRDRSVPPERATRTVTINGRQGEVMGVKGRAIVSGNDKPVLQTPNTLRADLGELDDEQLLAMHAISKKPIMDTFETSGTERSNCVHGAAKVANEVFGTELEMARFATPQDAVKAIADAVKDKTEEKV